MAILETQKLWEEKAPIVQEEVTQLPDFMVEQERSRKQVRQWITLLRELRYFKERTPECLEEVALCVEARIFDANRVIFKEGDQGEAFYAVYSGEIAVSKNGKVLTKLGSGDGFGETGIDTGKRSADATTTCRTILLAIEGDDYRRISVHLKAQEYEERTRWLRQSAAFAKYRDVDAVARRLKVKLFDAGSVIAKQDDPVRDFYMVKRGVVDLFKQIKKRRRERKNETIAAKESSWVLQRNWRDVERNREECDDDDENGNFDDARQVPVGMLGKGQVFGELGILQPGKKSPVTAIALTSVTLYALSVDAAVEEELGLNFHVPLTRFLNRSLMLYNPPHQKLAHYYRERDKWQKSKKKEDALASVMSPSWMARRRRLLNRNER